MLLTLETKVGALKGLWLLKCTITCRNTHTMSSTTEFQTNGLTDVSIEVFDVMSCIGYSPAIVKERRKIFHEKDVVLSSRRNDVTFITAGSKGEGLTSCFESDYDRLNIYRDIVCIFPEQTIEIPDTTTGFYMSNKNCHGGHFTLTLLRHGKFEFSFIEAALIQNGPHKEQISSDLFTMELGKTSALDTVGGWNRGLRTGPAVTSVRGIYHRDDVFAFRCLSQRNLLTDWSKRERKHNWPSPDIIEEILKLEAQLVPVGCKGSENQSMEWRVCFIPGELKLCDSLNETQYKLYILLKLINKNILQSVCKDISSYMMKNVTFWIAENNPTELFVKENLLVVLQLGIQMLIDALKNKSLPYYMIPHRNLFIGRQCLDAADLLIDKLEEIMTECPRVIKDLPKFHKALTEFSAEQLIAKGHDRDTLESLELKRQYIIASYSIPGLSREEIDHKCWKDKTYRENRCKMYDMVLPDWRQYLESEPTPSILESIIASMNGLNKFPDQYRRFARSYFDIIWPHIKEEVDGADNATEEEIIDFLAILRVKVEIALS